jgi:hypothetical protein
VTGFALSPTRVAISTWDLAALSSNVSSTSQLAVSVVESLEERVWDVTDAVGQSRQGTIAQESGALSLAVVELDEPLPAFPPCTGSLAEQSRVEVLGLDVFEAEDAEEAGLELVHTALV